MKALKDVVVSDDAKFVGMADCWRNVNDFSWLRVSPSLVWRALNEDNVVGFNDFTNTSLS